MLIIKIIKSIRVFSAFFAARSVDRKLLRAFLAHVLAAPYMYAVLRWQER